MALVLQDRVRETTSVVGTGDADLLGAVTGYQAFSVIGNTNTCYYTIADQGGPNWEVGIGTYSSTGPVLQRTTVLSSSNSGNLVSFTAGTKDIFVTYPSEKAVYLDGSGNLSPAPVTIASQLNLTNASDWNLYASGAGNNYMAGSLGIGATPVNSTTLYVNKNITGSNASYAVNANGTIQSDVTSQAVGYSATPSTAASAFTLGVLYNFYAAQGTLGSTSAITTQVGYYATSLTNATNNRAFAGNIAAATGAWNLYMSGTANNYMAGSLGIGTTSLTSVNFYLSKNITGATSSFNSRMLGVVQSDVTSTAYALRTDISTAAAAFTLGTMGGVGAYQPALGAASIVGTQYGFFSDATLTGATNNYGFYGNIAAPTAGSTTARTAITATSTGNVVTITTSVAHGFSNNQTITIGLTANATALVSGANVTILTAGTTDFTLIGATSNTVGTIFTATGAGTGTGTVTLNSQGSGRTLTVVNSTAFTYVSTNSYTYGDISLLTGPVTVSTRWNFYASGTAPNYMAGQLVVGTTTLTGNAWSTIGPSQSTNAYQFAAGGTNTANLASIGGTLIGGTLTGTTTTTNVFGITVQPTSTVAAGASYSQFFGAYVNPLLNNTTIPATINGVQSSPGLFSGALGGTVTNATSFLASASINASATTNVTTWTNFYSAAVANGAAQTITNVYGFYGLQTAGTGRFNLYMAGTADNLLMGNTGIGAITTGATLTVRKNITGATTAYGVLEYSTIASDVTSIASGFQTFLSTQAAAFTLSNLYHFYASQDSIGAGSSLTTQIGFLAETSLTGGTNNRAFQGNIAAASNAYNLYMGGTANNYLAGSLGIGSTALTDRNLGITKNITGGTSAYGILQNSTIQSDVTSNAYIYHTNVGTQATAFTLGALFHYSTSQSTIGAGSTVTAQYGFIANSNLTGATNNYGFYGDIPTAANRWNLYMNGTAPNYLAGSLGIGATALTDRTLHLQKALTGGATVYGVVSNGQVQSDVTAAAIGYRSVSTTLAAAFTLPTFHHFYLAQGTVGAGSAITTQGGYVIDSGLTGATNNRAFWGTLAAATGRYNLYIDGTADNYIAGSVGIGSTPDTVNKINVAGTLPSSSTNTGGIRVQGTIPSTTTGVYVGFDSIPYTQAAAFTVNSIYQFRAYAPQIGAGSAVTSNFGYFADPTNTTATNNYGVYSGIAAASGRWNIYAAGTANNYLAGSLGIGSTSVTQYGINVAKTITGNAFSAGVVVQGAVQSDVTSRADLYLAVAATQATAFTASRIVGYKAQFGTVGAGSTITAAAAFEVDSGWTGAATNYGFYGNIASGSNRYNLYMNGTADNYLAGSLGIGAATLATAKINLGGTVPASGGTSLGINYTFTVDPASTTSVYYAAYSAPTISAGTLPTLGHFVATQGTYTGTVTNQYGFFGGTGLTGATNNYGFYGNIAAATGRYNLYMAGTAPNYLAGNLGIGSAPTAAINLLVQSNITGATTAVALYANGTIQSDVTNIGSGFSTSLSTQATTFTLGSLYHYDASQGTIGANSTVTTQIGHYARATLTGGTNNYAFYGDIPAAAGRRNIYMAGTASNYMAGNLGIGLISNPAELLDLSANGRLFIQATRYSDNAFQPVISYRKSRGTNATPTVVSSGDVLGDLQFFGYDGTQFSIAADINVVVDGTPGANDMPGKIQFSTTPDGSNAVVNRFIIDNAGNCLNISTGGLGYGTGSGGAVTQATSRTTGVTLNKTNGAITLVSAAGSTTYQTFTVTNSTVAATDTIIVNQKSGTDKYIILVTAVAAGSFQVTFATTGGTTTEQPVFNFAVIKAVTA